MTPLSARRCYYEPQTEQRQTLPITAAELDTSELVELLQRSTVEHLTVYRQFKARDFRSAVTLVSTDFEALYAYKRGDYQPCVISRVHSTAGR